MTYKTTFCVFTVFLMIFATVTKAETKVQAMLAEEVIEPVVEAVRPVSYTHLTLPTN